MSQFSCFVLTPLTLNPLNLVWASIKADGIAILTTEFMKDSDLYLGCQILSNIQAKIPASPNLGLSLSALKIPQFTQLIDLLNTKGHWLILSKWHELELSLTEMLTSLPPSTTRKVLLEINDLDQLNSLKQQNLRVDGLIAKGNESGGYIGEDSAFVLTQKLLKNTDLPVYVQGGISQDTAAACRAVGASGVVLKGELVLMPETYFPSSWQSQLNNLTGQETTTIGDNINQGIRVFKRPPFTPVNELEKLAEQVEVEGNLHLWQTAIDGLVGWDEPQNVAWPIGQGIALAQQIREKYYTTGRYLQGIINDTQENIELSRQYSPLAMDSPLAKAHQTKYPIVQGPMTRVSDRSLFAEAVAKGGGLPLIALALMKGQQVEALLTETKALLGEKSWGIGILGFVPQEVRQEQLAVVKRVKPPFALIAGGRPDQARELEEEGITTYLHVPNLPLLEMFVEQGARHFVLEGRECGGHIGPLSSFVLWSTAISFLLKLPPQIQAEIQVLLAGGIHDRVSASMVSVMASPLASAGIKIGVLMGSAYLFTTEAVTCGAILPQFQQQALECYITKQVQTSPGHASRCANTPFVQEFLATRRRMLGEKRSAEEIKNTLESLTLGRLRIATKGIVREGNQLNQVDETQQLAQGMYMLGQVATMRNQVITIPELHQQVSENTVHLQEDIQLENPTLPSQPGQENSPLDIAIIGISTLLPQAQHPQEFWDNILHGVSAITEIPSQRWDWRLYYSSDRQQRDKVYSKWGGFIQDVPFEPLKFGIPPKSLKSIEPMQLLALEAVRRALIDAGAAYETGNFPKNETCVILGASGGMGDLGLQYATRSEIPRMVKNPDPEVWERLPEWTEESFPGLLMNVISGRVANRFDLGGSNFTVDAACASSLTAVDMAVQQLVTGKAKLAIAGGVDAIQSPFGYFCFSKTQALSPSGQVKSFDRSADGIVISEGVAMVVLKPLGDAERDGDRIYAVIKGLGSSSDGKGLSLTAPASSGQKRAFLRAYHQAGFPPSTLGIYEAHGTGTVAGDGAELTTISNLLPEKQAAPKSCVLSSVKTMIGHTKSTAGVAGLIRVTLGLYHQVLPNHLNVENPLAEIEEEDSPLYLLKTPKPWLAHPDYPRRGAVSAFGFGGTNFHAVLEEYQGEVAPRVLGTPNWDHELIVIAGESLSRLREKIHNLATALANGAKPHLKDLAYSYALDSQPLTNHPYTASIVVANLDDLKQSLTLIVNELKTVNSQREESHSPLQISSHIFLNLSGKSLPGKVAFLFPGQVSQYPNMGLGVALYFPEVRNAITLATRQLKDKLPKLLSQYIFPPSAYSEAQKDKAKAEISETHVAQCCLAAIELGYFNLITRLGVKPDLIAGHSYGEYAALMASGVISPPDFIAISQARGQVMSQACQTSNGAMAVVKESKEKIAKIIADIEGVVIANHNAPLQVVISGKKEAVTKAVERMQQQELTVKTLNVTGAFHSSEMASAQKILAQAIAETGMYSPQVPVYSNITAQPYPQKVDELKKLLSQHLLTQVEFVGQIKQMYADGARIFVEIGPKHILSHLVNQILAKETSSYTTIPLDPQERGLKGFLSGLAMLINHGVKLDLLSLFNHRNCQQLNLNQLSFYQDKLPENTWLLNGGGIRKPEEKVGYTGKIAPLNGETSQEVKSEQTKPESVTPNHYHHDDQAQLSLNAQQNSLRNDTVKKSQILFNANNQQSQSPNSRKTINSMNRKLPSSSSQNSRLAAYQSYQETMRQFLQVQEKVMEAFLTGNYSNDSVNEVETPSISSPQNFHLPETTSSEISRQSIISPPITVNTQPVESTPVKNSPHVNDENNGHNLSAGNNNKIIDKNYLTETLLNLVSDRTGYPPEMLGLDQDLEAELGIDSIKRVEILGALPKVLPADVANKIKGEMETLTQVKTLNGLVEILTRFSTNNQTSSLTNANDEESGHNLSGGNNNKIIDKNYLSETLLNLVSDRTGYPPEMLGLEQDLEAELGIDSIKRVEILGALPKVLPSDVANKIKGEMETLTQVKTLNGLVDLLTQFSNLTIDQGGERDGLGKSINEDKLSSGEKCNRYLMKAQPQPLPPLNLETSEFKLTGLYLITAGDRIVTQRLSKNLEKLGAQTAIITQQELVNPEAIRAKIDEIKGKGAKLTGLIHLVSVDFFPTPENLTQWQQLAQIQAKSLFNLIQYCGEDLQQNHGKIIATSLMGGYWGRNKQLTPGLALGGSHNGLLKTMMIEWENVEAKVIDFDHHSFTQIPSIVCQELINWDQNIEIGYANKQRFIFKIVNQPVLKNQDLSIVKPYIPQSDWVVLSIGGARGITAEIVKEIVKPNMTLILVGRSPKPTLEEKSTKGIIDPNTLKNILIKKALAKGEKPLPVEIDKQLKQFQNNRSIFENLAYFSELGVKVEYHSLDVRDESEFGSFIDNIYDLYGKIDAVIQGAGIIQDKLIVDKTLTSFEQVFHTKVDSTFILSQYLRPESLKLMVLFASIAGRTGNKGQVDYAAANEVVNRMAWRMRQKWMNTRIIAINWGPWDVTGMASPEVKRQFRERGVIPISPEMGRQFFRDELYYGSVDEVEIISGIYQNLTTAQDQDNLAEHILPLIDSNHISQQDNIWTTEKTITVENEPILLDHCLDDNPVMPAAVAMELMAEFTQQICSDLQVIAVENLRVLKGIILTNRQPVTVKLVAEIKPENEQRLISTVQIQDLNHRKLYQAEIVLGKQLLQPQIINDPLELKKLSGLDINTAYPRYCFHGEKFQLIRNIQHFGEQGAYAIVQKSNPFDWLKYPFLNNYGQDQVKWLFDPGLVDAALQMSLIWTHIYLDKGTLPTKFGKIIKYQDSSLDRQLQLIFVITHAEETNMKFNGYYLDQNNQIVLEINDIEMTCSQSLKRLTSNSHFEKEKK